ncbi:MAG: hypothetical protein QW292_09655 [Candidatus Parvarchaeota archaeon]
MRVTFAEGKRKEIEIFVWEEDVNKKQGREHLSPSPNIFLEKNAISVGEEFTQRNARVL